MVNLLVAASRWAIPVMLGFIPLYGLLKGVKIYDAFIEGAREGLELGLRMVPFIVSIFVALAVFQDSGAMGMLVIMLRPILDGLGMPGEVLPLAIIRPMSGNGALAMTAELIGRYGPDSYIGRLASTIQGSTDTTFYVLSLYFGSVGIKNPRHSIFAGLSGDFAGFIASVLVVRLVFGGP